MPSERKDRKNPKPPSHPDRRLPPPPAQSSSSHAAPRLRASPHHPHRRPSFPPFPAATASSPTRTPPHLRPKTRVTLLRHPVSSAGPGGGAAAAGGEAAADGGDPPEAERPPRQPGGDAAEDAQGPRDRLREGQDGRARPQGPEGAWYRSVRLRRRPDPAAPPPAPPRLQEPLLANVPGPCLFLHFRFPRSNANFAV